DRLVILEHDVAGVEVAMDQPVAKGQFLEPGESGTCKILRDAGGVRDDPSISFVGRRQTGRRLRTVDCRMCAPGNPRYPPDPPRLPPDDREQVAAADALHDHAEA